MYVFPRQPLPAPRPDLFDVPRVNYNSRFTLTFFLTDVMQGCSEEPPSPSSKRFPLMGLYRRGIDPITQESVANPD